MSNGYTLPAVSGPKEVITGLLDSSLLPLRFGDLDQVRCFYFSSTPRLAFRLARRGVPACGR